ncbi:MAG: TSUP family transporter [Anaerolineae bacterium]|nr:TSUP family transporter [Anaerolineae bacterium]
MEYLLISFLALVVSALTLFSGFGLGTVLMPVFALFFPVPVAVAATAVVHLANNLFKVALLGRWANWSIVTRFALPAAVMAMVGAALLTLFDRLPPLVSYQIGDHSYQVTAVKLVIALVIIVFALFDLLPHFQNMTFGPRYLSLGGMLSGFFGGLSGNQGALRSAFLIKAGLDKEAFVGTGVVATVLVDVARLLVYGLAFYTTSFAQLGSGVLGLILAATLAAFVGAVLGRLWLKKVTLHTVQLIVGVGLILLGLGLGTGLL